MAVLVIDLHFPDAGSLKAKRKELSSIKAQLSGRLGVAVAETGYQDLWQRARLTLVVVRRESHAAVEALDRAERYLSAQDYELTSCTRSLLSVEEDL